MKQQEGAKFIKKLGVNSKKSLHKSVNIPLRQLAEQKIQETLLVNKEELKNFIVIGMMRKQIFCIYHPQLKLYGSVDQHALHQRVRYQYYCKILQGQKTDNFVCRFMQKSQARKKIQVISTKTYPRLLHICELKQSGFQNKQIQKYGIKISIQSDNNAYLQSYSQILGRKLQDNILKQICIQMIELQRTKSNRIPIVLDNMIAENACKSAIKFGDEVTRQWCQDLLYNATLCGFPWKCVHGRPTVHFEVYRQVPERNYTLV